MTRARWIISSLVLCALWSLGAFVLIPRMERDLAAAAQDTLSRQTSLQKRLGRLQVAFDGQQAVLTGKVRTPDDLHAVETAVRDLVRAPTPLTASLGLRLNPVADVNNAVEVLPFPAGWLLLAANGPQAKLLGTAANEYEARDLFRSVQDGWSARGGTAEDVLAADAENHDEAANVAATLRGIPTPPDMAQAYVARIGETWKELSLNRSDDALFADARAHGVSEEEWNTRVVPVLRGLRDQLKQQQAAEMEKQRLAHLPPAHLFIAARGSQVVVRGEVGSLEMKRAVLDEALEAFSPRRVLDEIRVSPQRRPTGDFGPVTTALLPPTADKNGRSLFVGLSDEAWKAVDWQIAPQEQSWKENLTGGLKPADLLNDSEALTEWLQARNDSTAPPEPAPAFITLALFDAKVIVSGQVAEESTRSRIVAAVRKAYAPRVIVLHDDLRVHAACRPSTGVAHTVGSLPSADAGGVFAIAFPGGSWTSIPVTKDLIEAGGLARCKQLPAGVSAALVEERSAEAIEQLRLWMSRPQSHASNP